MSDFYKKLLKQNKKQSPGTEDDLLFVTDWVNQLHKELIKRGTDKEFVMDLLETASNHFTETFNDEQKAQAFIYTLGLLSRNR